jgi:hypothetical protein
LVTTALACVAPLLGGNTEEFSHLPHLLEVASPGRSGWPVGGGGGGVYDVVYFWKASLETCTCGAHRFWRGVALVLLLLKVEPPRRNIRRHRLAKSC